MATNSTPNWGQFPGMTYTFDLEANFDVNYHRSWFAQYWSVSIVVSVAYVIAVHLGTKVMANRKPFDLRTPLMLWSILLSLFSVYGSLRILPELFDTFNRRGFQAVICDREFTKDVRIEFVMFLFIWSKAFELVDTFFIVARKQKLIVLHWYHHFATLIYGFFGYSSMPSIFR